VDVAEGNIDGTDEVPMPATLVVDADGVIRWADGPATLGLARAHDGTLYVAECSGTSATGVWRLRPDSVPVQIAELPADGFPNGMAIDGLSTPTSVRVRNSTLYVTSAAYFTATDPNLLVADFGR
jgi:sugar lactone lactonase YvrE